MADYLINRSAPNLTTICIDEVKGTEYSGRLCHSYRGDAVPFYQSMQMIMLLNQLFDGINYPQASTICRSFRKPGRRQEGQQAKKKEMPWEPVRSKDWVLAQEGRAATFYLHVRSRCNSTWQGNIIWKEESKWTDFDSVLELLWLIQSAVDTGTGF